MEESTLVTIDYIEPTLTRNILENVIAYFNPRVWNTPPSNPIFLLNWFLSFQDKFILGKSVASFILFSPLKT